MRMNALTSLRFFAAAIVVISHMGGVIISADWMTWFVPSQAVSLFFVLSGFVLQSAYGGDLRGLSVPTFMMQRVARVWPLHAAVCIAVLLFLPTWAAAGDPLRAFFLIQAWSPTEAIHLWAPSAPSWSLSAELFFYGCFPFMTAYVRRHPVLAVAAGFAMVIVIIAALSGAGKDQVHYALYIFPVARLPEFVTGMALAEALPRLRKLQMHRWAWTSAEFGALGALVAVNMMVAVENGWVGEHVSQAAAQWLRSAGCVPAATAVIMVLALGRGAVSRMLSHRGLVWLGEASFALYLVHWPLLGIAWPGGPVGYLVVVGMATILAHTCIERPAVGALKSLMSGVVRNRVAAVAA